MFLAYASASLYLYLDHRVLHLRWRAGVTGAGFAQGLTAATTLTQAHQLQGWVTLNHHVYPLAPAEQLCLQQQALLPLHQTSLQRVAIILPAAAFQGTPHESLITACRPLVSYQIQYFSRLAPACRWVQTGVPATG